MRSSPKKFSDVSILLVGTGAMAREYAKVFDDLGVAFAVLGRGQHSAAAFTIATGKKVLCSPTSEALLGLVGRGFSNAVVAVDIEQIAEVVCSLMRAGVKRILAEKPLALAHDKLVEVSQLASALNVDVFVAYNRRFYQSIFCAERLIDSDGGITSAKFDFTEWKSSVDGSNVSAVVKERWVIANSSHVLDLVFFMCGLPLESSTYVSGELPWHPAGATFAGAGVTVNGITYSYSADWDAPGRWGVEFFTRRRRLVLRPLEVLQQQQTPLGRIEELEVDKTIDQKFKPGLYLQVVAFLSGDCQRLCDVSSHIGRLLVYEKIAGYTYQH